jgi:hypothetical protein
MSKHKTIESMEGISLPKRDKCDRCGNDFSKGAYYLYFPYKNIYIALCHICNFGLMFGFYNDVKRMVREDE